MIDERFIIFGAFLNLIGITSYLIATIKGHTKPNRVTWSIWALAPLIAFAAQIQQHVGLPALLTFMTGFGPLLIFIASFINKNAAWKITTFDLFCGALSLLGLALWMVTQTGNIAILFSILADGLASIPTIIKSYKAPETENSTAYLFSGTSALITLFALQTWDFTHLGFPLYIFLDCLIIYVLVKFKAGKYFSFAFAKLYKK